MRYGWYVATICHFCVLLCDSYHIVNTLRVYQLSKLVDRHLTSLFSTSTTTFTDWYGRFSDDQLFGSSFAARRAPELDIDADNLGRRVDRNIRFDWALARVMHMDVRVTDRLGHLT